MEDGLQKKSIIIACSTELYLVGCEALRIQFVSSQLALSSILLASFWKISPVAKIEYQTTTKHVQQPLISQLATGAREEACSKRKERGDMWHV